MTALLGIYLESALLLALGGLLTGALARWGGGLSAHHPRRWLAGSYAALVLALALPGLWRLPGLPARADAAVEVWTGPRAPLGTGGKAVAVAWPAPARPWGRSGLRLERRAVQALAALIAAGGLLAGASLLRARRRLARLCRSLPVIKRHGRVRLCAADGAAAPYAARAGGLAFVVVPTALLADPARLRLVMDHEAEHHRRGDLRAAGLVGLLRLLHFWNPGLALWERAIAELQDLACDRRVLQRRAVSALDYGRCLLWAAEQAGGPRYLLPGARALGASSAPSLRRRILMLTGDRRPSALGRLRAAAAGLLAAALLLTVSWAVHGSIVERKLTRADLVPIAGRLQSRSGFPLLVDERVAAAVTRRIATLQARELTRTSLTRMRNYRSMIEDVFTRRGLPLELLGLVMHESGFDNEARPDRPPAVQAAGIWQFIPGTARRLGLQVGPTLDERLEPRRATEAAAQMLSDLHRRFGDWPLAIAAYNGGSPAVEKLIAGASVPEARARVLAVDTEFGRYLPGVMAAIVLIDNPALADN